MELTLHLLLEHEAAMNLLELRLHRESTDVSLQMDAVDHAHAEQDEGHQLHVRAAQATAAAQSGSHRALLLVLKGHPT